MADPDQLAILKRSVEEWNAWRQANPEIKVDLREANLRKADLSYANLKGANLKGANLFAADLSRADLSGVDLSRADLSYANFSGGDLSSAYIEGGIDLRGADLSGADLSGAHLRIAILMEADLRGADLTAANLTAANLTTAKRGPLPSKSTTPEPHPRPSSSTTDWLSLIETVGGNLLVTAATLASIIQGLDVIERRWKEHQAKRQQGTQASQPSPASSTQPASPSHKTHAPDKEIIEILLVMDDGSHHNLRRWVSDPDELRAYIDAFSDLTSKVKPLQVVFKKREGRALVVDVTNGGKDNKQLNVILSYLDADPL